MTRYDRQERVIGPTAQAAIRNARVLVIGAGGLGCTVIPQLVGAGVQAITIVDHDKVDESNLHRQNVYMMQDINEYKAIAMSRHMAARNPQVRITPITYRLTPANAPTLLHNADIVVDAADSFAVTYTLSDMCRVPLISASVIGTSGYVGWFCGTAPDYRALFPDMPDASATCATAGVLGPVVATLGAMQAQLALQAIIGTDAGGRLTTVDLNSWRFGTIDFRSATSTAGYPFIDASQITPSDYVVDATQPLTPAGTGRHIMVCKSGLRAWRAANHYAALGVSDIALVATG